MPETESEFNAIFDVPGEIVTLHPNRPGTREPSRLLELLDERRMFELHPVCRDLIERAGSQRIEIEVKLYTLPIRRDTTLAQVERALDKGRLLEPWVLIETLLQEAEDEDILDRSGVQNVFWIPRPVSVHFDVTDGRIHIDPLERTELDRFTRVFFIYA